MKKFFKKLPMLVIITTVVLLFAHGPRSEASPIDIDWIGGSSGPRNDSNFSSISWEDYSNNVVHAVKNNLTTYDNSGEVIELTSDIIDGSTILDLMDSKSDTGDFSFSGKEFDGLGFFIESINGIENIPEENVYWSILVNDQETNKGASEEVINQGDVVKFVLDSVSNDEVKIEYTLDEYLGVLGTEINPYWKNKFLDEDNAYPYEKGHSWHEIVWIKANLGSTFVPEDISMTISTERWDHNNQEWIEFRSETADSTTQGVISQSFSNGEDEAPGTEDDEEISDNSIQSQSFIFSSSGVTFLPITLQGQNNPPEYVKVDNAQNWLLDGKVRIRFLIEIPFKYSNGTTGLVTGEKILYKKPKEINHSNQQLLSVDNISPDENSNKWNVRLWFEGADSNDLIQVQKSQDLENWYPFKWKSGAGILDQQVEGSKNFFRIIEIY